MKPSAFIAAALVLLATIPAARAGIEAPTAALPSVQVPDRALAMRGAWIDDASNRARGADASSPGGAIYNPFSNAPATAGLRAAGPKQPARAEDADFTFTIVVALAGMGLLGYVLRRALDA